MKERIRIFSINCDERYTILPLFIQGIKLLEHQSNKIHFSLLFVTDASQYISNVHCASPCPELGATLSLHCKLLGVLAHGPSSAQPLNKNRSTDNKQTAGGWQQKLLLWEP